MALQRLDKLVSSQGALSRKDVKILARGGEISVNGKIITDATVKVDDTAEITVSGKRLNVSEFIYIMMNKPQGVVSASRGDRDKTVIDLVPQEFFRSGLFPAGRLDKDTTGFVLITDDGAFAHKILSPKNHIMKVYHARLARSASPELSQSFKEGIVLSDGTQCMESHLRVLEDSDTPLVEVRLCEGKYHQIKRMFAAMGNHVEELHRVQMGNLLLDSSLSPGECRLLTNEEVIKIAEKTTL